MAIELEIAAVRSCLDAGDSVLDVGCGNGYSTSRQKKTVARICGVDFSPAMIEAAKLHDGIDFGVADARKLPFSDKSFDVVYTTRTLINLPSWEEQKTAISECLRVAKRRVVFSEAFWEPLQKLNAIRLICGLGPLVEHDFNRYLKTGRLIEFLKPRVPIIEDFSGVYYLGSRVLRELVTYPEKWAGYSNPINSDFYKLQKYYPGGGLGIQQLVVIDL